MPARHLLWFPGSPSTGAVPPPLAEAADALGLRVLSWPRPGYAGRERVVGRRVADAADDARAALDAAGVEAAVAVGYSGGGPHALAAAALLGGPGSGRVTGVLALASPAPWSPQPWWTAGMTSPQALRAAAQGRAARERLALVEEFDPAQFTDADWAALAGPWGAVGDDAQAASQRPDGSSGTPEGLVDDDLALVSPWGVELADLAAARVPVLLAHGADDRVVPPSHGEALLAGLPHAQLERVAGAGHVAVLLRLPELLQGLLERLVSS